MKFTPEKAEAFFAALAETANVSKACAAIAVSRRTAYNWREADPGFAAGWDRAMKAAVLGLEDEAHRRAFEGLDKPVFYQGEECGTVREYSDTLAIFLLKAHNPEKYRENSKVELEANIRVNDMTDEEIRAEIAALVGAGIVAPSNGIDDLL
jgi:hypothetical protein